MNEVQKDHELHHVENPSDRSDPSILSFLFLYFQSVLCSIPHNVILLTKLEIPAEVHVKQQDRGAFLAAVEEKAKEKGTAVDTE